MPTGYVITAADVNNTAGNLVTNLWNDLEAVKRFKAWLDDADHNAAFTLTLGIASGDDTIIRNAIADLGSPTVGLYAVAHGIFVPGGVNNFFANAKKLSGVNYAG